MATNPTDFHCDILDASSESLWQSHYPALSSFAKHLVYSFGVPCWRGQENEIADDVVQETSRRVIEHMQKGKRGDASPIGSLKHMMMTTAYNYCIDMRRRDRRLIRIATDDWSIRFSQEINFSEVATENASREMLFTLVAREIALFPPKQREALLTDLANRMSFGTRPTALQAAFLKVGIQLSHYQRPLPTNAKERSRHASLLTYAYKRVARLQRKAWFAYGDTV